MKNIAILILFFSLINCTPNPKGIISKTINNLSKNAVQYDVKQLTIQGNGSDTISFNTTTSAIFSQIKESSDLLDFKFIIEDSLIHPYFNISMKNTVTFDGNLFKFESINPMQNQTEILNRSEIKASKINQYKTGHIPMLLELLKGDSFVHRIVKDTIIADRKSLFIKQADTAGVEYELFIQRKECFPTFLRIIINPKQPFIQEYNYLTFDKTDSIIIVDDKMCINSEKIKPISKGDRIPDWNLQYLTGEDFDFSPQKGKITILCLSMINCGACQKATKDIAKMYQEYINSSNIRLIVFYPIDRKEKLEKYVKLKDIDYPVVYNSKKNTKEYISIVNYLRVPYPNFIILDESNKIVWMRSGYNSKVVGEIEEASNKFCLDILGLTLLPF